MELRLPRTATVAAVMEVDTARARYMIRRVRDRGLVMVNTHHKPAAAIVNRGARGEVRFTICQRCLKTWPCNYYMDELNNLITGEPRHFRQPTPKNRTPKPTTKRGKKP